MGYEATEAVGRKSIDFLTPESCARAINETLPLFWRTGYARSVGYRFRRKDGAAVDLLLDAELGIGPDGSLSTYAALHPLDEPNQSDMASKTLRELRTLTKLQRMYEGTLLAEPGASSGRESQQEPEFAASEVIPAFPELAQDTSLNLRALARAHEELAGATVEHQSELVVLLKSIDKTLAYLADAVVPPPWMSG